MTFIFFIDNCILCILIDNVLQLKDNRYYFMSFDTGCVKAFLCRDSIITLFIGTFGIIIEISKGKQNICTQIAMNEFSICWATYKSNG